MGAACSYRPQKNAHLEGLETEAACPQQMDRYQKDCRSIKRHATHDTPVVTKFARNGSMPSVVCGKLTKNIAISFSTVIILALCRGNPPVKSERL